MTELAASQRALFGLSWVYLWAVSLYAGVLGRGCRAQYARSTVQHPLCELFDGHPGGLCAGCNIALADSGVGSHYTATSVTPVFHTVAREPCVARKE
jgi:hypothetical protein